MKMEKKPAKLLAHNEGKFVTILIIKSYYVQWW